jgi:hypothetical protein
MAGKKATKSESEGHIKRSSGPHFTAALRGAVYIYGLDRFRFVSLDRLSKPIFHQRNEEIDVVP